MKLNLSVESAYASYHYLLNEKILEDLDSLYAAANLCSNSEFIDRTEEEQRLLKLILSQSKSIVKALRQLRNYEGESF